MFHLCILDYSFFNSIEFLPIEDKAKSISKLISLIHQMKKQLCGCSVFMVVNDIANNPRSLEDEIRDLVTNHRADWIVNV